MRRRGVGSPTRRVIVLALGLLVVAARGSIVRAAGEAPPAAGAAAPSSDFATIVEALTAPQRRRAVAPLSPSLEGMPLPPGAQIMPRAHVIDHGEGSLVDGRAHVNLGSVFAEHAVIDEPSALVIITQALGKTDCAGLAVTNRTATGFDVVDLHEARCSAAFAWLAVAPRRLQQGARGSAPMGPMEQPTPAGVTATEAAPVEHR